MRALKVAGWVFTLAMVFSCSVSSGSGHAASSAPSSGPASDVVSVRLLFTNDFESAYHPTEAFWRSDMRRIGGIAQLGTLINSYRAVDRPVFLFDSGDIFTGTLAKLTRGALAFELMNALDYDAMVIGNHEFEYGWQELVRQKHRAAFPVLGANLVYRGTDIPFAQPWTVVQRRGVRIGVIGVLGQDAATALIPANIAGVDVRDPIPVVRELVDTLRADVDLIVLLTHQGHTAPMQTDDEARPEIQRDIEADLRLAGAVPGIDVLLGGHADAGTPEPVVHPQTGTLIMQTYGQGYHLGVLDLELDANRSRVLGHHGRLVPVNSDALAADRDVARILTRYEQRHAEIKERVGTARVRLNRQYNVESDLGNLFADIVREHTGSAVGLMPSGALRKDIAAGSVRREDLLDVFPFEDRIATMSVTGKVLQSILEQGLSLERGMLQVSGVKVRFDPERPPGSRIIDVRVGAATAGAPDMTYQVGTVEILARGGDLYVQAREGRILEMSEGSFADALIAWFGAHDPLDRPKSGRLLAEPSLPSP